MDCLITCLHTVQPSLCSCLKIKGAKTNKEINRMCNTVNSWGSVNVKEMEAKEKEEEEEEKEK